MRASGTSRRTSGATAGADASSTPGAAPFASPPDGVSQALAASAERCLRKLPDELLAAMATGLRANADALAPGALFRGRSSGGCAVGVTLRELAPEAFQFGRIEFWLWQRWRRGVERDVSRTFPGLQQLQPLFDGAVEKAGQAGTDGQPARAVGLWLAACAEAVLGARTVPTGQTGRPANARSRWARRRAHRRLPGQPGSGTDRPHRADMEIPACS